jgi:predicted nuclease of predicted toxin-antitoxin system
MRILFDQATPVPLKKHLGNHEIYTAAQMSWDKLTNGDLLAVAEKSGFDVLVTTDKNMRYQQNLSGRRIALVVLGKGNWPLIKPHVQRILTAIETSLSGGYNELEIP